MNIEGKKGKRKDKVKTLHLSVNIIKMVLIVQSTCSCKMMFKWSIVQKNRIQFKGVIGMDQLKLNFLRIRKMIVINK